MRTAICDDNSADAELLKKHAGYFDQSIKPKLFSSGEDLLAAIEAGQRFDVIFLDIKMGRLSGFDVARRLQGQPKKPLIIFVTESDEYVYRGYKVAWRYVRKPIQEHVICQCLAEARQTLAAEKIVIQTNQGRQILFMNDILYLDIIGRDVAIHTLSQTYHIKSRLFEQEELFPAGMFFKSHKSCLVNLNRIQSVTPDNAQIIVEGGDAIPLSRKRKEAFFVSLKNYHFRSG
ncbi:MAG: LytTR family DNA-binding domain-containing protein [Clostridiales bacterium]|jgi:DNA-binding LytR/AlgR family response regulator|nr:LytTR family DNA-binding domain-containing protein [Clostridiales bacterium]